MGPLWPPGLWEGLEVQMAKKVEWYMLQISYKRFSDFQLILSITFEKKETYRHP